MPRKFLFGFVVAAAALALGVGIWQAQPTEAQGPSHDFSLPPTAIEVAPGIFALGTTVVDGRLAEGFAFVHPAGKALPIHKPRHKPPKNDPPPEDDPPETGDPISCYSFMWEDAAAKWTAAEPYLFNPAGAGVAVVVGDLESALNTWDSEVGAVNIFGTGTQTSARLSADTSAPDDVNEIYFARIVGPGAGGTIAVTILWRWVDGPLMEWDMVFNTKFGWSLNGAAAKMDFRNIAGHEAGHGAGMGHTEKTSLCAEETMYPTASKGETLKQDLHDGDIAGIIARYS